MLNNKTHLHQYATAMTLFVSFRITILFIYLFCVISCYFSCKKVFQIKMLGNKNDRNVELIK